MTEDQILQWSSKGWCEAIVAAFWSAKGAASF